MNDGVKVAIQTALKVGGGYLVAKGITDSSTVEIAAAGLVAIVAIIWNWTHLKSKDNPS